MKLSNYFTFTENMNFLV